MMRFSSISLSVISPSVICFFPYPEVSYIVIVLFFLFLYIKEFSLSICYFILIELGMNIIYNFLDKMSIRICAFYLIFVAIANNN